MQETNLSNKCEYDARASRNFWVLVAVLIPIVLICTRVVPKFFDSIWGAHK